MRILFISDLLSYGGASKLIYDLLPRMKKKGNDCELLILTDKNSKYIDELEDEGIKVQIVPKNIKSHTGRIYYLKKYIVSGEYDIIHAHLFPTIYYCSVIKRILGKKCPPIVMTEHNTDNRRRHKSYLRPLEQFMYKPYDHVISISKQTQTNLLKWIRPKNKNKFSTIENGIDVGKFQLAEPLDKKELYPEYREGNILLLTVGRFEKQKNHEGLIKAFAKLPTNYVLLLCGEGSLEHRIKMLVNELNVRERVVFLGFRSDVARIMHTADIMVIPSIWEGFGLIAAEGMAAGIPIAASDVPGLRDVVGDAGVTFNPIDSDEMSKIIISIGQKGKTKSMSSLGQKKAVSYSINRMVSEYLRIYKFL